MKANNLSNQDILCKPAIKIKYALRFLDDGRFMAVSGNPVVENSVIKENRIRVVFDSSEQAAAFIESLDVGDIYPSYPNLELVVVFEKE